MERLQPWNSCDHHRAGWDLIWLCGILLSSPASARHGKRLTGLRPRSSKQSSGLEECSDCGVRDRCNNTCACINLQTIGQANIPPTSLCHTEQATITTVDQVAARLFDEQVSGFLLKQYSQSYHMLSGIEKYLESLGVEEDDSAQTHA